MTFSCKMRLSRFLMQDETFPISHAGWDFSDFSCRMRLFGFLMLHETFCPKDEKQTKKTNTLLRPLHYVLAVNKLCKKAHLISDFIKKISPQVGLEPTKMRHDLKKSVSILPEGEEKIISFISDFSGESLSRFWQE